MVIEGYEAPDFTSKVGDYTLQMNPEKYDVTAEPTVNTSTIRLSSGESIPSYQPPDQKYLTIVFYVDATGVVPGCDDVSANIKSLRDLGMEVNGNIHRTNYIKVRWGTDFVFPSTMQDLKTEFPLFKPDGTPVRAKVTARFKEFVDPLTQAKQDNKSSPDLSHIVTVVEGDNLPMLCHRIYGDPKYYIQVAAFNGLLNFTHLKANQRIIFPRLES